MENKRKIIHLIQALDNGGCENMLLRTLPLLTDFEHKIITLNHKGELAEQFERKKIDVRNIDQKNLWDIFSYFRLLKEIKKEKPDLIFTYLFHADFVGRLFLQVFLCHSRAGGKPVRIIPSLRTTYNHKKYWSARLFEKLTRSFVKNYMANSQSIKNFYVKNIGVDPEKITVIPNGIDTAFYGKIERDENLKENLNIKKSELVIICVANLHINKGHKYLLEAFENVYAENNNIKLLLVGDGNEKENLLKQIENYSSKNNILFLGKRTDVPQLLKISDIFVLPTLFEGMSNAIMEAMATGLPIITTDIPENRELITSNEVGILIPTQNAIEIQKNISLLLENETLRKSLGGNVRKEINEKFEIGKITREISKFYKSL